MKFLIMNNLHKRTHENTSVSYSCKGTISWQLGQLRMMFVLLSLGRSGSLQKGFIKLLSHCFSRLVLFV